MECEYIYVVTESDDTGLTYSFEVYKFNYNRWLLGDIIRVVSSLKNLR